jgi:hypothetical protein
MNESRFKDHTCSGTPAAFTALAVLRMYDWRSLDHHGQLPLEWLGSELASFEALLATRRRKEGGWKKVMKPQITPAVEAVAADVHLGTTTMKSVSLPVSELKP